MKRFLITFCVVFTILMLSAMMQGQTGHSVTLTWVAPSDATASGIVTMYRGTGDCSTNPSMASVGTVVATVTTYVDAVSPGTYCYFATHTENKSESVASNNSVALLRPNAPSGLTLTVK